MAQENTSALARTLRIEVLKMIHRAGTSHIGSCFSIADIMAVLYGEVLNYDPKKPDWQQRDRVLLSKGHAAAMLYATLAESGFFPKSWLEDYCANGSKLPGHATHKHAPGVELSTGSLGHGLPVGLGMALAMQKDAKDSYVYVILSDGECDEGSNWEAALFAGHHKLKNVIVFVDYNKIQSYGTVKEVLDLHPLADKWKAFNWHVQQVDGHNHGALKDAIVKAKEIDQPSVIISDTVKGKGVSFMEDKLLWHYRSPREDEFEQALKELEAS